MWVQLYSRGTNFARLLLPGGVSATITKRVHEVVVRLRVDTVVGVEEGRGKREGVGCNCTCAVGDWRLLE